MSVRDQMLEILRSNETRRIHFSFTGTTGGTVSVGPSDFQLVADALASNRIAVVEGRFDRDIAMYSAFASGDSDANTFYLGQNPRSSRSFNALIVHESVHAAFDLRRVTIPWVDNEAAAYVAQGYYLRNSGYPRYRLDFGSEPSVGYLMVNEIISGGDATYFLNALRDSLRSNPQYHGYISGTITGNG